MHAGIERLHGVFSSTGVDPAVPLGRRHGVVKRAIVDDFSENFVDVDMGARALAVDGWMTRRENQSMCWQPSKQPIDAF